MKLRGPLTAQAALLTVSLTAQAILLSASQVRHPRIFSLYFSLLTGLTADCKKSFSFYESCKQAFEYLTVRLQRVLGHLLSVLSGACRNTVTDALEQLTATLNACPRCCQSITAAVRRWIY